VEVNGQLHAKAVFLSAKASPLVLTEQTNLVQNRSEKFGEKKNNLPLTEKKTAFLH
jgi:hypothetical protein